MTRAGLRVLASALASALALAFFANTAAADDTCKVAEGSASCELDLDHPTHDLKEEIANNTRDIITNDLASRARDDALGKRIDENSEAIDDAIALSAAIPDSWLSDSENFAIAVGGGFTDGSSAIGGIGTFRINKNLSAYGGGSTLTDGGTWAAKGGVRLGW